MNEPDSTAVPEMFTTQWRTLMVEKGLEALAMAETYDGMPSKMFELAKAQAYFQAANIRSRPADSVHKGNL